MRGGAASRASTLTLALSRQRERGQTLPLPILKRLFREFSGSGIGLVLRPVLNWGLPFRNGVASAGLVPVGREFLHYHTHSKASSPLGLPQRNAGLPTNRPCASLQTGLPPGQARRGAVLRGVRG